MQASSPVARTSYSTATAVLVRATAGAVLPRLAGAPCPAAPAPAPPVPAAGRVLFDTHHPLIEDVVRHVIRRRRLRADEAEDFTSAVMLRLLEHDCAVLRSFEGRSSLRTFLVRVVERLLLDRRIRNWGKWRPSAQARRLGRLAVQLEVLVSRDGLTFSEAAETLRTNCKVPHTVAQLWRLHSLLPSRPRRRTVSDRELDDLAASGLMPDTCVGRPEAARAILALRRAIARLPAEDRALVEERFVSGIRPVSIAAMHGLQQKKLYRRFSTILKQLRACLEAEGVEPSDVSGWIGAVENDVPGASVLPFRK
jgi:RNA polymerase sigma factor for flagellar operon FliA